MCDGLRNHKIIVRVRFFWSAGIFEKDQKREKSQKTVKQQFEADLG